MLFFSWSQNTSIVTNLILGHFSHLCLFFFKWEGVQFYSNNVWSISTRMFFPLWDCRWLSSFLVHSEFWGWPHFCAELEGNGFFPEFTSSGNFLVLAISMFSSVVTRTHPCANNVHIYPLPQHIFMAILLISSSNCAKRSQSRGARTPINLSRNVYDFCLYCKQSCLSYSLSLNADWQSQNN